jgi:sugar phosphate isomerase/epimerase
MIIAGHTWGTPGYDLDEALRLFKSAALDAAEVIHQDDYPAAVRPFDKRSVQRAAASASAEGIPIVALIPYTTSINSLEPTAWQQGIDEFRASMNAAQELGADRVRVYAGRWQPGDADHAAHFGTMTQTAADTARLVSDVNSPAVRVLYDQANLTFTHDEAWPEAFAVQGDLVGHVHVKDLVFKDPDAPFRASDTARVKAEERAVMSRVVGSGVLPWADIIGELTRRGYDDVLTLEYEYRWHPQDLPEPAVGFAESARVLRSILASLEEDR